MDNRDKMALQRWNATYAGCTDEEQAKIDRALAAPIRSADRVELRDGMRVFTNNLDRGVVDLSRLEYEWHAGEKRWVPWFDVRIDHDYRDQPASGRVLQSNDRVATRYNGRSA
jgi:hypothetical protein